MFILNKANIYVFIYKYVYVHFYKHEWVFFSLAQLKNKQSSD